MDVSGGKIGGQPLRVVFLDLNAYFASVEQQENPALRGRPVAVVPLMAETTSVIAASYEAKAFGVKTGTRVMEARLMCPDITILAASPPRYVAYHHRVLDAVSQVLPIDKVCSIDEMQFRLLGKEKEPTEARRLGEQLKAAIRDQVGEQLRCSVGIAPNAFLAKVGTELEKPDGMVVLNESEIFPRLAGLKLTDFPGINRRMKARLQAHGIFTTEQMLAASPIELRTAFGSIIGERWWYLLRGVEVDLKENERQSLSHSHVLAPEYRNSEGARKVLLRLTQKAAARLRANGLYAGSISVGVRGQEQSWDARQRIGASHDSVGLTEIVLKLWAERPPDTPTLISVTFSDLTDRAHHTPSLFDEHPEREELSAALDQVNQKFGKNAIFLASLQEAKDAADEKIAFNKTWLFSEGKDDHMI